MPKDPRYIDGKDMWHNSPEFDEMLRTYLQTHDSTLLNKLIKAHRPLVIDIANRYKGYLKPSGILDFDDLIQEGSIGLMTCIVDHYNPDKVGRNFYAYAISWIKQGILRAIADKNKTIRLPVNQVARFERLSAETEIYQKRYGRKPTIEELVKITDFPVESVKELLQYSEPISLDIKYSDGDIATDARAVDQRSQEKEETTIKRDSLREALLKTELDEEERTLLFKRFGLNGYSGKRTLDELADEYGISHEGIRQRLQTIRRKIRIANGLIPPKEKSAKS
jgi:RNA polymerase primary sigma factor